MPDIYESYRNTSTLTWTREGRQIKRTLYLRAETEIAVLGDPDCPQRGDCISSEDGSVVNFRVYCAEVEVKCVSGASATEDGFLWEVAAMYKQLSFQNPTVNKARWSVGFRPRQYLMKSVGQEADQEHYGLTGSAASRYPEVTTQINLTSDGAQGVQVDDMTEVLTIEFWKYSSTISEFLGVVRILKDTVNNAAFEGPWGSYDIGEVRLSGITVTQVVHEMASVQVEFSRSPNKTGIQVYLDSLGTDVSVTKNGWQYLWVRYIKDKDSAKDVRPLAVDAHVATIYQSGDYTTLGITDDIWL